MSDMLKVLSYSRLLISNPNNWGINEFYTKNNDGSYRYCARGAILAILRHLKMPKDDAPFCQELLKDIENCDIIKFKDKKDYVIIAEWNNSHTHQEVLALFDRTINRLKREETKIDLSLMAA